MNMIKQKIKILIIIVVVIPSVSYHVPANPLENLQINTVNPVLITPIDNPVSSDNIMYEACKQWQLTKEQVNQFFQLAQSYAEAPYSSYYQIPCIITGTLQLQGQQWQYTIQGGATGTWQQGKTIKYFGCNQTACESLVIMPTDNMNPDE